MLKNYGIPWGISEAAFNLKDLNYNYQYKAFGVPWLGLKRGLEEDMVVSPYSVALSLQYEPAEAISNLRELEKQDMYSQYGFYESIDYTAERLDYGKICEPVKTYMAHHQGLILLSINNLINDDILVKRFSFNPEIEAVDILLQERMPEKAIITKEKKEKVEKIKIKDYESYSKKTYTKIETRLKTVNVISNGKYTVVSTLEGESYSKFENILINRFKETSEGKQGIFFYIKNLSFNNIWSTVPEKNENNRITFEPSKTKYVKTVGNIETDEEITVAPDEAVEIRRLKLKNIGLNFETLEVTSYFEPVLSRAEQDYAHPAFNNLFLNFEKLDIGAILVKRNKRGSSQKEYYLGASFFTESETIGDLEYEIEKERFIGKQNNKIPDMIKYSKPYSKNSGMVTDPVIAMKRTIKLSPGETVSLDLILAVDEQKDKVIDNLNKYQNTNVITKTFELAKAKVEAENIYLGVKGKNIETYQKMLGYLLFQNPTNNEKLKALPKRIYSQSELWKFGISGDLPILLAKIKDANDVYIISEILKAYEFFRTKNIKIDLVILNEETNSYDYYIKFEIENAIQNRQIGYLKNQFGGIFIINQKELKQEDIDVLNFRANLIIDSSRGSIEARLRDLEEEYLAKTREIEEEKPNIVLEGEPLNEDLLNLKYYNEYGGFSEDGFEYKMKFNNNLSLPTVWSDILANPNFGTLITQNLGGFTWCNNSRLNRLSSWCNNPIQDMPSEIIYFKNAKTGLKWSLSQNLNEEPQEFIATYGFGYTIFKTVKDGINQTVETFVPLEDKIKVNIVTLQNVAVETKKIKIIYYIKPVLGEDEIQTNQYIDVKKDGNVVIIKNLYKNDFKENIAYISSSKELESFTGKKRLVMQNGNIVFDNMDNKSGLGETSCAAIEISLELKPFETKEIILNFGSENSILDVKNMAYKYSKISNCKEELKKVKNYWYEMLTTIDVKTPLESMNLMLNGWANYQTIVSRLWSRTGFYQSGGAIGFRDQLQDTLGIKYVDCNMMKTQIIKHARHQFIEGDVLHWWHEETKKGIRTRFSDDLLWMCYVVWEYIDYTGDYQILDEEIPYLKGDVLEDGIDERYDLYEEGDIYGTLYEHCIKAIEKSLDFGEHGLPKIGSGDWNDGLNTVGNKKRGESIWLRIFLV